MRKSSIIIFVLVISFLTGAVLITGCSNKKAAQEQKEGEDYKHAEGEEHKQELVYACPMHPEATGKEGDSCSKCGMKLEAVKGGDTTVTNPNH